MDIVTATLSDPNLFDSTKATYGTILRRYQVAHGNRLTIPSVQTWLDSQTCSATTKRLYLAALKHADQRLALLQGQAPALSSTRFQLGRKKGQRAAPRALSKPEIRQLLEACSDRRPTSIRDRALIGLGLTTGMRHGALWGLNRADIDRRKRTARIYLKGGGEHVAPLSDEAWEYLRPWLSWKHPWMRLEGPAVFLNLQTLERLSYRSIGAIVARRATQAGLGRLEVHELRHTFVTQARLAGWSTLEIAAVTGHVTEDGGSRTIDRVYTDLQLAGQVWDRRGDRLT